MKYFYALILGVVQGLTEFLPVSSSGHLILFKHLFGMDPEMFGLSFDIALHVATLAAVCVVFRKKIWELLKKPFQKGYLEKILPIRRLYRGKRDATLWGKGNFRKNVGCR
jgi:undecaprenyl pyrophosphate phosphatase UppP